MERFETMYSPYAQESEVAIEGSKSDLLKLASMILSAKSEVDIEIDFEEGELDKLIIQTNASGLLRISLDRKTLSIHGSFSSIQNFAENLQGFEDELGETLIRQHIHIEYYPDNQFIDRVSIPLVVGIK